VDHLKNLVTIHKLSEEDKAKAEEAGLRVFNFDDLAAIGAEATDLEESHEATTDSIDVICYTSGTTGMPKGVMIPHKGIVISYISLNSLGIDIDGKTTISFLPLAHVFEKMMNSVSLMAGATICYFGGNMLKLMEDIALAKPDYMPIVPRLLTRLYDGIKAKIGSLPQEN